MTTSLYLARWVHFATLMLLFCQVSRGAEIGHVLRTSSGEALAGITIRATRPAPYELEMSTVTDEEGQFSFDLPDGDWVIEADPADILNLGYFCVPGIGIGIGGGLISFPTTGWFTFVAVPLYPELKQILQGEQVVLELDFEWMEGLQPSLLRGFRVERSTDLHTWQSLGTVLLLNPPIRVVDPAGRSEKRAFYRTVATEDFQVIDFGN
ncbi:carboxypeptidase-like regulatory domain-containing protein [Roseibacillus persicicus]|uniref:Carboxypeptidase regulatory-like domain-containing protein n=1 Tax=Roseibacillus persicicus TaxID=454148 RepID=A0A918WF91_9BACT|nr:carboxypeptidase-like regulatory domain-containing protein [Roseibacillus persicicus]GHC45599.1 hypothetical protein GCM10007100_08720 [Roseibacillus persicicus]